ncbi:unnamed protein product [Rhizoctonia solani]|uniref:RlpA-like protein double-psi beta-barrel domain-containing protein n=1 Tax=Rhizoctonia solani TaxID=456999 RepID=A0A8H3E2N4_9AGAM|nr:unnamed protein product [Rhizoctonia solani]
MLISQYPAIASVFGFSFSFVYSLPSAPTFSYNPTALSRLSLLNMLTSFVAALALAASVSNVAAGPIHNVPKRHHVARGYRQDADILEDYTGYHVRYLALGCSGGHGSEFFEACCHPLLRWQKLSDRPAKCIPSASASSSAVLAEPTATPIDEDPIPDYDDDCDESTAAPVPASTQRVQSTSYRAQVTSSKVENTPEPTPEPTTSHKPSSSAQPTTTKKSSSAEPEPTKGSGGSDGDITGGSATFFKQGGVAGACGTVHDDYDKVVALDYRRYGDTGKKSSDCGRTVVITNTKNGKTVTAKVADACPTCTNENCLDLSLGAFDQIATREEGMVPIAWHFA